CPWPTLTGLISIYKQCSHTNNLTHSIEMDDPLYDEFFVMDFEILEIVHDGPRRYSNFLAVDYRDFPEKIIDITTNTVVYPANSPTRATIPTIQN
ncbi:hypothetical protein ACRQDY_04095, partial [Actinotignum sp. GS-2025b]